MKLINNAAKVARNAWSMRMIYLSVISGALEVTLPLFAPAVSTKAFAVISLIAAILAGIARVTAQPKLYQNE